VGLFLDERVLEHIGRQRGLPPLVEEFGLHQPRQGLLQCRVVQRRDRLQELIGKRPPQGRPQLGYGFDRGQPIESGHERVMQRGGNRQCREGTHQRVRVLALLYEV
jgi:hypothetical protein